MSERSNDEWSRIDAFIDSLDENECRRVLSVLMYGEHKCQGAKIGCCGAFRCEPCHVTHLKSKHGQHAAQFWYKLCQTSKLTWKESIRTSPLKPGKSKRSKRSATPKGGDPIRKLEVPSETEQLEAAAEQMRKILRSQGYKI